MNLIFCQIMSRWQNLKVRKFEVDLSIFMAMERENLGESGSPPAEIGLNDEENFYHIRKL